MKRILLAALAATIALSGCGVFRETKPKNALPGTRLPVLAYEAGVEADPELAGLSVVLPPPEANAEWTQPGGNAAKSMGHLALGETVARAWVVSAGEGSSAIAKLNAAPVVAGGRVYTMDTQARVTAFDAASGRTVWTQRIDMPKEKKALAFGGGVSFGDGRVYATTGYGIAAAFDAATGRELWRTTLPAPLRGAPGFDEGRVYVMTQDNQLFVLSGDKGEPLWDTTGTVEQAGLLSAGAPALAQGTVVVGFSSGELNALRVENGRPVWQDALARTGRSTALAALTDIDASPVIDRGRVFAIGHGGRIAGLDIATGQRLWERNLAGVSTPWVAGDYIFVVTIDATLAAITRADGKVKWVTQLPKFRNEEDKKGPIKWSGPVLASDRLLLTGSNGRIISVSPYKGEILSQLPLPGPAFLPPVVAGNTVYVLTDEGQLVAFR
jgi:outer membrane protein assembly factor BamB